MRSTSIFYLFGGFMGLGVGFICTSYTPFLQGIGLTLSSIATINIAFQVTSLLAEVPTGMLADGRSRAWSLRWGAFFWILSALVYFSAQGFWSALLAEISGAFGAAFISGAKQAWLVDALIREGHPEDKRKAFATEAIISGVAMVVGGFLGARLATINPRAVWLAMAVFYLPALATAKFLMNGRGEPSKPIKEFEALRKSLLLLRQSSSLKWVAAALIVSGLLASFNYYWAIYFKNVFGQVMVGNLWIIAYGGVVISGLVIRRFKMPVGAEASAVCLSLLATGLGLALLPLSQNFGYVLFFLATHEIGRGIFRPLTDTFIHHRVESSYRATFGSLQSLIGSIGMAIVPLVLAVSLAGAEQSNRTIAVSWYVTGSLLALAAVILYAVRPRNRQT